MVVLVVEVDLFETLWYRRHFQTVKRELLVTLVVSALIGFVVGLVARSVIFGAVVFMTVLVPILLLEAPYVINGLRAERDLGKVSMIYAGVPGVYELSIAKRVIVVTGGSKVQVEVLPIVDYRYRDVNCVKLIVS